MKDRKKVAVNINIQRTENPFPFSFVLNSDSEKRHSCIWSVLGRGSGQTGDGKSEC